MQTSCVSMWKMYMQDINGEQIKVEKFVMDINADIRFDTVKRSFWEKQGIDDSEYCDVPSICEWKLDFMAKTF